MTESAYPSARAAAIRVLPHFARHGNDLPLEALEAIIDVAFWASLRREEGYAPQISLAFLKPQQVGNPLTFERPIPLTPQGLTRLAPAVERPGIHLGVWCWNGDLRVWGATRELPAACF